MDTITINDVKLTLADPIDIETQWIGQDEPLYQLQACWLKVTDADLPLTPRIVGVPGVGKTTLAIACARIRKQNVYIMQCTADTRPEDLLVTPVLAENGMISYHASPLLSAVITGGIAILDEGNRMSEKSWASLASLFDSRRMVESIIAGITIKAHDQFRAAVTMNEDSSTFEIPDYIMSRLQPTISVGFPSKDDEMKILSYTLPFSDEETLELCVAYLQSAHALELPFSVRDGINMVRYVLKQKKMSPQGNTEELFNKSIEQVLGKDALDLESLASKKQQSGPAHGMENFENLSLGSFFFPDDEELNPDHDFEDDDDDDLPPSPDDLIDPQPGK